MIGPIRRKLMIPCLREGHLWPLLGVRTLAWHRFARQVMADEQEDRAILRLQRRTQLGTRYYMWMVYRIVRDAGKRPRLVPERIYMPDDEDTASLLGTPDALRGRPYFAADTRAIEQLPSGAS